jgi:hypothetical protein
MRTPAGSECPFYYEDFHRGRSTQACRLIERTPNGGRWTPDLCRRCRVPRIVMANACPNLVLEGRVHGRLLGLVRRVDISATCTRTLGPVAEPEVGCGHCHEALAELRQAQDSQ